MKRRIPILIVGNAGEVGGEILRRRELETYWALSAEEAACVEEVASPDVCVIREAYALDTLRALGAHKPRCLVLIEPDGWARRDAYYKAGATALVPATANDRILEALGELTGVPFAKFPRVPFQTPVVVETPKGARLLETENLSVTGVGVKRFPSLPVGSEVKLRFEMLDPPIRATAIVSRVYTEGSMTMAGLSFKDLTLETRSRIEGVIGEVLSRSGAAGGQQDGAPRPSRVPPPAVEPEVKRALRSRLEGPAESRAGEGSKWLDRVSAELTPLESRAALGQPVPSWVHMALDVRLALSRARGEKLTIPERWIEHARAVASNLLSDAEHESIEIRAQVTQMRASIFREMFVEGPAPLAQRERAA